MCPGGLGGYPQGGLGPQAGRFQGPGAFWAGPRGDPANFSRKPAKTYIFGTFGGVGGTPQGGLGPQAGRIQGLGASWAGPRGDPANFLRKPVKNTHFWLLEVWGVPPGGPRLAESRDPGPPAPVRRGRPRQFSAPKTRFFGSFGGLGGTPRGSGAPAWQIPGTRSLLACPFPAPAPSGQVRGQPALSPALKPEKSFFAGFRATLTGCERRSVCWEPLLLVERPAQAARTHNPTRGGFGG